jgi:CRP-like cAMP-binding protein
VNPRNRAAHTPSVVLETLQPGWRPAVDELLSASPQIELSRGEARIISSLPDAQILVVEEGFAVLRGNDPSSGRGVVLCHGGPGTFLPFIDEQHSVVALVDSRLTVITVDVYERLLELPGAAHALLRGLETTLRQKQRTILAFSSVHHVDRVRQKLHQLASEYGFVSRDGIVLQLPITHELLGEMIGSARETVTRAVDDLEQTGFLRRQGHSYLLHVSPDGLQS